MNTHTQKTANGFTVGRMVELTENWSHPDRPKIVFHKGTKGKVLRVLPDGGEVEISMNFPHSPPMTAVVPATLLRWA